MKIKTFFMTMVMASVAIVIPACGCSSESGSDSSYNDESSYSSEGSGARPVYFRNSDDVRRYLDGKTFSGDGFNLRFYNYGQSVDMNGVNVSNNVRIYDIGMNDNDVSYATVQVINPAGVTTTLTLLAVEGHANLIDPNDGTVYEY